MTAKIVSRGRCEYLRREVEERIGRQLREHPVADRPWEMVMGNVLTIVQGYSQSFVALKGERRSDGTLVLEGRLDTRGSDVVEFQAIKGFDGLAIRLARILARTKVVGTMARDALRRLEAHLLRERAKALLTGQETPTANEIKMDRLHPLEWVLDQRIGQGRFRRRAGNYGPQLGPLVGRLYDLLHPSYPGKGHVHDGSPGAAGQAVYNGHLMSDIADLITAHYGFVSGEVTPAQVKRAVQYNLKERGKKTA